MLHCLPDIFHRFKGIAEAIQANVRTYEITTTMTINTRITHLNKYRQTEKFELILERLSCYPFANKHMHYYYTLTQSSNVFNPYASIMRLVVLAGERYIGVHYNDFCGL